MHKITQKAVKDFKLTKKFCKTLRLIDEDHLDQILGCFTNPYAVFYSNDLFEVIRRTYAGNMLHLCQCGVLTRVRTTEITCMF